MKLFKTRYRMWRKVREDFSGLQSLTKSWWVCGFPIWVSVVDSEEIPSWANIQRATLGSTDWTSRLWKQYATLPINQPPQ